MRQLPHITHDAAITATRFDAKKGYFKEIDDYIRSIGQGNDVLYVLILMKNYNTKTAQDEVAMLRRFIDGRLPLHFFGVVQQDSIGFPLLKVKTGHYNNSYPFSYFFLARCLKHIATRKNHKSFKTDEGVEWIKKFFHALSQHRNCTYSDQEIQSLGIDYRLPVDWTTHNDSKFWHKNMNPLKAICIAIDEVMQGSHRTTEEDYYSLKAQLEKMHIYDDWEPNPESQEEHDYIYNKSYTEKVSKFVMNFVLTHYYDILNQLSLPCEYDDTLDNISISGDTIIYTVTESEPEGMISHRSSRDNQNSLPNSFSKKKIAGSRIRFSSPSNVVNAAGWSAEISTAICSADA